MVIVQKNKKDHIRISINEFNGFEFVDIHVWYKDANGDDRPGKQKVTFSPDRLSEVISALESLRKEAEGL